MSSLTIVVCSRTDTVCPSRRPSANGRNVREEVDSGMLACVLVQHSQQTPGPFVSTTQVTKLFDYSSTAHLVHYAYPVPTHDCHELIYMIDMTTFRNNVIFTTPSGGRSCSWSQALTCLSTLLVLVLMYTFT